MKFAALLCALALTQMLSAAGPAALYDIPLKDIHGQPASLKTYQGKVLLIVNVASQCGATDQYRGLQALQQQQQARGFTVLGFPCNDFGAQEPGTNAEIQQFCASRYQVTFPLFDKIRIKGADAHPLYAALTGKGSPVPGDVGWNFTKFLISRDGRILKRFDSNTEPDDPEVTKAILAALSAK